jgi:hypothetical protein
LFALLGLDDDFSGTDERIGESIHADFIGRDDLLALNPSRPPIPIGQPTLPPRATLAFRRSGARRAADRHDEFSAMFGGHS